jgi:importin-4
MTEMYGGLWEKGLPLKQHINEDVRGLIKTVMDFVVPMMSEEFEKATLITSMQDFRHCLESCGPSVIESHSREVIEIIQRILSKTHPAQEMQDEDESSEYESLILNSAMETVVSLSNILGESFADGFELVFGLIVGWVKTDESLVCGVLAECCLGLGRGTAAFMERLYECFLGGLNSTCDETRSNSAYGLVSLH